MWKSELTQVQGTGQSKLRGQLEYTGEKGRNWMDHVWGDKQGLPSWAHLGQIPPSVPDAVCGGGGI